MTRKRSRRQPVKRRRKTKRTRVWHAIVLELIALVGLLAISSSYESSLDETAAQSQQASTPKGASFRHVGWPNFRLDDKLARFD